MVVSNYQKGIFGERSPQLTPILSSGKNLAPIFLKNLTRPLKPTFLNVDCYVHSKPDFCVLAVSRLYLKVMITDGAEIDGNLRSF